MDKDKLKRFAELLQVQQLAQLKDDGTDCDSNRLRCATSIKPGRKYTKVNVGTSGKYMIVNKTGEIFGIKAYGVIHRGHQYGTLDTIDSFWWGNYTAIRREMMNYKSIPEYPGCDT